MKLTVHIESANDGNGYRCWADADGLSGLESIEANTLAIGAIEIAKASLLAHRWGLNIGNQLYERPSLIYPNDLPYGYGIPTVNG